MQTCETAGCLAMHVLRKALEECKTWEDVSLGCGSVREVDVHVCSSEQETGPEDRVAT